MNLKDFIVVFGSILVVINIIERLKIINLLHTQSPCNKCTSILNCFLNIPTGSYD